MCLVSESSIRGVVGGKEMANGFVLCEKNGGYMLCMLLIRCGRPFKKKKSTVLLPGGDCVLKKFKKSQMYVKLKAMSEKNYN